MSDLNKVESGIHAPSDLNATLEAMAQPTESLAVSQEMFIENIRAFMGLTK